MKLLTSLLILTLGLFQMNAQMTFERTDFLAEVGDSPERVSLEFSPTLAPSEGTNQNWVYTNIPIINPGPFYLNLDSYTGTSFSNANIFRNTIDFNNAGPSEVPLDEIVYELLNEDEYSRVGSTYLPFPVDVSPLTGMAGDSLNFIETSIELEEPDYYAWFPMEYGDERESNFKVTNNALLTVAAFGINQVPFATETTTISIYEVAGSGTLFLTDPDDQSVVELEALLMKTTYYRQDSFLLGGALAPPALVAAFGVAQGQTSQTEDYYFWVKGLSAPALSISMEERTVWMASDLEVITSTQEVDNNAIPLNYYPNPTNGQLNLEFEKTTKEPWVFSIYNSLGQKVFDHQITQPNGNVNESITLGKQIHIGNYLYVLHNEDRKIMSSGGLQIN